MKRGKNCNENPRKICGNFSQKRKYLKSFWISNIQKLKAACCQGKIWAKTLKACFMLEIRICVCEQIVRSHRVYRPWVLQENSFFRKTIRISWFRHQFQNRNQRVSQDWSLSETTVFPEAKWSNHERYIASNPRFEFAFAACIWANVCKCLHFSKVCMFAFFKKFLKNFQTSK